MSAPRRPTTPLLALGELPDETYFQNQLSVGLNAPGRLTRVHRQNAGRVEVRRRGGGSGGYVDLAPEGAADLTGLVAPDGYKLEVEVKVKEPHKPEQVRWQNFITAFGGIYVLVRWSPELDLDTNVARGVQLVDEAIVARRAKDFNAGVGLVEKRNATLREIWRARKLARRARRLRA